MGEASACLLAGRDGPASQRHRLQSAQRGVSWAAQGGRAQSADSQVPAAFAAPAPHSGSLASRYFHAGPVRLCPWALQPGPLLRAEQTPAHSWGCCSPAACARGASPSELSCNPAHCHLPQLRKPEVAPRVGRVPPGPPAPTCWVGPEKRPFPWLGSAPPQAGRGLWVLRTTATLPSRPTAQSDISVT